MQRPDLVAGTEERSAYPRSPCASLIEGERRRGRGELVRSTNPADARDCVFEGRSSSIEDVGEAVEAAQGAFLGWRRTPVKDRARVLLAFAGLMRERRDGLGASITREQGKTLVDARAEVQRACEIVESFAGMAVQAGDRPIPVGAPGQFNFSRREPLGVVGLITPWNVPLALPCWKLAPALVTGNTAVLKPSQLAPGVALILASMLEEAGLPPGVLNVVLGSGAVVGAAMAADDRLRAFSFTGGGAAREQLYAAVSRRMTRFAWVAPEAGGKNAIVVLEDADLEQAAAGIVHGAFVTAGQRCTASSRLIVAEAVADELVERVVAQARALVVGDGLDPRVDMGPVIHGGQLARMLAAVEAAVGGGAQLLCGGRALDEGSLRYGHFIAPTILGGVEPGMRAWTEELFGPVLSVTRAQGLEGALALANASPYRLSSAIYSQSNAAVMRFVDGSNAQMIHVNAPTVSGEPYQPYAGIRSAADSSRAMEGLNFFTEEKLVLWSYGDPVRPIYY